MKIPRKRTTLVIPEGIYVGKWCKSSRKERPKQKYTLVDITEVTCPNPKSYCWVDIYGGHKQLNSGLIGEWDRTIQQRKGSVETPDATIIARMKPARSSRPATTVVESPPQPISAAEGLQSNAIESIIRQPVSAALRERSHSPRRRRRRSPSPRYRSPSPSTISVLRDRRHRHWKDRIRAEFERSPLPLQQRLLPAVPPSALY